MKTETRPFVIAVLTLMISAFAPQQGSCDEAEACVSCEEFSTILADMLATGHQEVTNLVVETKTTIESPLPVGDPIPVPAYCEVRGVRFYDPFIVKLPAGEDWNGRYYQTGNGGAGGSIDVQGINSGLLAGFAAAGASGEHDGSVPFPLFLWAFPPSDPVAQQKVADCSFLQNLAEKKNTGGAVPEGPSAPTVALIVLFQWDIDCRAPPGLHTVQSLT